MDQTKNAAINSLLQRVARRAEKASDEYLAKTFVPIEPLPDLLDSLDNQVLYGRRGTGKTHILKYLGEAKRQAGDLAVYIDLRTLGDSGGLYSDTRQPLALRATHLLVDLVEGIHTELYNLLDSDTFDEILDAVVPCLDELGEAATQVRVVGSTERAVKIDEGLDDRQEAGVALDITGGVPHVSVRAGTRRARSTRVTRSKKESGPEVLSIQFGRLSRALTSLLEAMHGRRLWLLLDEWSNAIPRDLQPFLADLLRRSFFPVPRISVKIATVERQSSFRKTLNSNSDYMGIDLGADTAASLDLDDFLVFREDRTHALTFFAQMLHRHICVLMAEMDYQFSVATAADLRQIAFGSSAFEELVKASEGVPRDALNVAGLAAAVAADNPISYRNVRAGARAFYLRDKEGKISDEAEAQLSRIVEDCVRRETRVLALKRQGESKSKVIQELYDYRLIHRLEQGVILDSDPSTRFDLYLVDFGCFVDLLSRGGGHTVSDGTDLLRVINSKHVRLSSPSRNIWE